MEPCKRCLPSRRISPPHSFHVAGSKLQRPYRIMPDTASYSGGHLPITWRSLSPNSTANGICLPFPLINCALKPEGAGQSLVSSDGEGERPSATCTLSRPMYYRRPVWPRLLTQV